MSGPRCRSCAAGRGEVVLDLGAQPPADHFPAVTDPGPDPTYPLRMWCCAGCGLAQLAEDPTTPDESRGVEPEALVRQAADAVDRVGAAGLLPAGASVVEYGSPHGGSWRALLVHRGLRDSTDEPGSAADVVLDCFGLMHEADQAGGLRTRVDRLAEGGVLLLQYHSLAAILALGQWNALRHGHFAYYSTPALVAMLAAAGLTARTAWRFPLYGGTVLLAAGRGGQPDAAVRGLIAEEDAAGVREPGVLAGLQRAASGSAAALRRWLVERCDAGEAVLGYGAASRTVALLCRAGIGPELLPAVADASTAKHGRRMPGSGVPVIPPAELVRARPRHVLLFLPDLLDEVRAALPGVETGGGQWVLAEPYPAKVTAPRG